MTKPRELSSNGIYHVVVKGNNKNDIFCDDEDNLKFLYVLKDCQAVGKFDCYAYCLMVNHAHLMLRVKEGEISELMSSIMIRYVKWYNHKYERTGRLFEDRFFSKPVNNISYFLTSLQYIYNNPVKAGFCESVAAYKWSSYKQLFLQEPGLPNLTLPFYQMPVPKDALRILDSELKDRYWEPRGHLMDTDAMRLVKEGLNLNEWKDVQNLNKAQINLSVQLLWENGANKSQITRVLGITRYNVCKLLR